jgi:hypothetical protein
VEGESHEEYPLPKQPPKLLGPSAVDTVSGVTDSIKARVKSRKKSYFPRKKAS